MKLVNITIYPQHGHPIVAQCAEGDHVFFIAQQLDALEIHLIDSNYGVTSGIATKFNGDQLSFVFTIEGIRGRRSKFQTITK